MTDDLGLYGVMVVFYMACQVAIIIYRIVRVRLSFEITVEWLNQVVIICMKPDAETDVIQE